MARGIAESGLFRQERVKLNGRTSDPSNPEPGESWLRFDLDGETDKYGEFRVYDGSSVQSVAIVAPGTTQTEAEEVLRVQTPSGVGVIWADLSPPYHIFIVAQINNSASGSNQYVYDNVNSNTVALRSDNTPEFGFFQDSAIQFGFSADTNEHIFSALHGSTANLRVDGNPPPDGSQSASGNVLSGFTLSAFNTGEFGAELDFGEVLIYTQDKSSIVGDVESYLSDKWGFEI